MSLSSRRFVAFQRLKAAANNQALIKLGETGGAVQAIQLALLSLKFEMPVSTNNYSQVADGIFGNETRSTVKAFQAKHALLPDGIVGKQTLGKLDKLFSATSRNLPPSCGNCSRNVNVYHPPGMIQAALSAESDLEGGKAKLPTKIRFMTSAEEKKAKTVFGNSLTFSLILVSNALGLNGRAFVALGWSIGIPFVKTRTGTIVNWGNSPSDDTFFHELTHVWQSQHHERAGAYMQNALLSQAAAEAAGGSAYAFIPDRKFMRYGAEQIAQQVERGRSEIIRLIRAVGPLAIAPHNLPFPSIPYWETPGAPGVLT